MAIRSPAGQCRSIRRARRPHRPCVTGRGGRLLPACRKAVSWHRAEAATGQERRDRAARTRKAGGAEERAPAAATRGSGRSPRHRSRGGLLAASRSVTGRGRVSGRRPFVRCLPAAIPVVPGHRIWLALKIEEYVPEMMPISRASDEVRIAAPPNRAERSSVMTTVRLVMIERPSVCRIEWLTIAPNGSPAWRDPVLADAVEDHDRVVDAEADDGQHRGHEQGVDLERGRSAQDRERADDDDHVVEQRHERSRAVAEAEPASRGSRG